MNLNDLSPMLVTSSRDVNTLAPMLLKGFPSELKYHEFFEHEDAYEAGLLARVVRRLTRPMRVAETNRRLLAEVKAGSFKSLWVFKGMNIYPETLEAIRRLGVVLINYNADHPLEFFQTGSGNKRVLDGYKHFDLHLTYSREIKKELVAYAPEIPVGVVPFGHNVDDALFDSLQRVEEVLKVCFIGNPDPLRAAFLEKLNSNGIEVDVFGSNWRGFASPNDKLLINGQVVGRKYLEHIRKYRVQLNILRPHNYNSHNMRSFEVPACGGVMLAPRTDEHSDFFEAEREAFYYSDDDEAVSACKRLLAMSKGEVDRIRINARTRSIVSKYSYMDRAIESIRLMATLL